MKRGNLKEIFRKSVTMILVVSFVVPASFFAVNPPKKADAITGCTASVISGVLGKKLIGKILGSVVPVGDSTTQLNTGGSFLNDCVLKPIAIKMARTMVRNISNSIVNWINNDFNGKPGFVTDIRGLATDSADEVIGNMIYGSDLNFLCSPFSFQVRLALATKYNKPFQEQVRCTASEIIGNVNNFANNNGGATWDKWLNITTEPQNNVYGAYLMADSQLAQNIQTKLDDVNNMLNRNGGFLDFQTCDQYESDEAVRTRIAGKNGDENSARAAAFGGTSISSVAKTNITAAQIKAERKCAPGKMTTKTPGSLVQQQANTVLGGWAEELHMADSIDQVVGALISKFTDKMISGATGFLGLSGSRGYASNNINYADAATLSTDISNPENAGLGDVTNAAQNEVTATGDAVQIIDAQFSGPDPEDATSTTDNTTTTNPDGTTSVAPVGGIETLDIVSSGGANRIGRSSVVTLKSFLNTEGNASIPTLEISMQWRNSAVPFSTVLLNGAVGLTQNGITKNFYPQNAPGITFTNVSVGPAYNTAISMSGLSAVGANGQYSLVITAKDNSGNVIRAGRIDFIVE